MKTKKIPLRTCIVTKEKLPKQELIRVVRTPDKEIIIDETLRANGRGAYLKKDLEVFERAKKTKALNKALEVEVPDTLFEELKNYVYNEVQTRLGEVSCGNLFFAEGTDNSVEGTYIFNKNNEYHILFTEKGKIRSDIVTDKKREVLWNAVNIISANIIINFAICNREKGKDFRRALFAKEKEIFSLFGQDFQKRKDEEIEEILKKNPYNDI